MKNIFIILALVFCSLQVRGQIFLSEIQDTIGKGYVPITDYDPALATYIQKYMLLQDYLRDSIDWGIGTLDLYQVLTNGNDAGGLDAMNFGEVEADEFIGDLRGAVLFKAQAGETLAKGDVVYVSGISGNTTIVSKADADDAAKMPAFGVVAAAASSPNPVDIYTFGTLSNLNTSGFAIGDILYVSTTAGQLTATPPTGESALLQNIAKVTRVDNSAGSIKISGAGRTNATPNLNTGRLFVGNASNQAVADGTVYVDIANSRVGIETSTPDKELDIESTSPELRFSDSDDASYTDLSYSAEVFTVRVDESNQGTGVFRVNIGGGEIMRGLENGNLGIGTSSPTELLDVQGSGSATLNIRDNSDVVTKLRMRGNSANDLIDYRLQIDAVGDSYTWHDRGANTLTHYDDVDTYIWRNNAGTEQMRKDANGDLGIATTNPLDKLHVNGAIRVENSSPLLRRYLAGWVEPLHDVVYSGFSTAGDNYNDYVYLKAPSSAGFTHGIIVIGDDAFAIGNTSVETGVISSLDQGYKLFGNSTGIGIGTNSVSAKLDVNGDVEIATVNTDNTTDDVLVHSSSGTVSKRTIDNLIEDAGYWDLSGNLLYPSSNLYTVGIGTSSPVGSLDINSSGNTSINVRSTFNNSFNYLNFHHQTTASNSGQTRIGYYNNGVSTSSFYGWTQPNSGTGTHSFVISGRTAMRVMYSSLTTDISTYLGLGRGSSNAARQLHMYGSAPYFRIEQTAAPLNEKIWEMNAGTDGKFRFAHLTDAGGSLTSWMEVNRAGNTVDVVSFPQSSTNLGIATTSPTWKLDVSTGANASQSYFGRNIVTDGIRVLSTSGRTGFVAEVANAYSVIGDESLYYAMFPFDSGHNGYAYRTSVGTTLVDKFWTDYQGNGYFAGRVGIGTSSPTAGKKLHVEGNILVQNSANTNLTIKDSTPSGGAEFGINVNRNTSGTATATLGLSWSTAPTNANVVFQNDGVTIMSYNIDKDFLIHGGSTAFFDYSANRLGIGTLSPSSLLDIEDGNLRLSNTGAFANSSILIYSDDGLGSSFTQIEDFSYAQLNIEKTAATGVSFISMSPISGDGSGNAIVRLFRNSGTATDYEFALHYDGGASVNHLFNQVGRSYINDISSNNLTLNVGGGNVGIGTTSPSKQLTIESNGNTESLIETTIDALAATTLKNADAQWRIGVESFDDGLIFRQQDAGYTVGEALKLGADLNVRVYNNLRVDAMTQDDTESQVVVWDSGTNNLRWRDVSTIGDGDGIYDGSGSLSSSTTVTINGYGIDFVGSTDEFGINSFGQTSWTEGSNSSSIFQTGAAFYIQNATSLGSIHLRTGNPSPSTALYVKWDGNIGIGTLNPDELLVVEGANSEIVINDTSNAPELSFENSGTTSGSIKMTSGQDMRFLTGGTSEAMRITSTGEVAIGRTTVTSPYQVHIAGDVKGDAKIRGQYFETNNTSTRDKYRVWTSSAYAIGMQSAVTFGGLNDYAMTFQFINQNDRGFWWGDNIHTAAQGAMSLTTNGHLVVASSVRVGAGENDTSSADAGYVLDVEGDSKLNGEVTWSERALGTAGDGTTSGAQSGEYRIRFSSVASGDVTIDGDITYSDANDEFTVTNAGKYRISYSWYGTGGGSNECQAYVKINNTIQDAKFPKIISGATSGSDLFTYSVTFTLDISAGHTVDMYQNAVTGTCSCDNAYLEVERLIGY